MAKVNMRGAYSDFIITKGIQRAYNFLVRFHFKEGDIDDFQISDHGEQKIRTIGGAHVKNITIPTYQFQSEGHDFGPFMRAVPVLQRQPLSLTMELEEDRHHSVGYFIQYLQNCVMNEYGVYRPDYSNPTREKLKIEVFILDMDGDKIAKYTYYNCYIQTVSESTYDYASNTAISNTLTFNADFYSTKYYDRDLKIRPDEDSIQVVND